MPDRYVASGSSVVRAGLRSVASASASSSATVSRSVTTRPVPALADGPAHRRASSARFLEAGAEAPLRLAPLLDAGRPGRPLQQRRLEVDVVGARHAILRGGFAGARIGVRAGSGRVRGASLRGRSCTSLAIRRRGGLRASGDRVASPSALSLVGFGTPMGCSSTSLASLTRSRSLRRLDAAGLGVPARRRSLRSGILLFRCRLTLVGGGQPRVADRPAPSAAAPAVVQLRHGRHGVLVERECRRPSRRWGSSALVPSLVSSPRAASAT